MPAWLHGFAEHQPATPVFETLRGLLTGTSIGDCALLVIAWCASMVLVSAILSGVLFHRRTS